MTTKITKNSAVSPIVTHANAHHSNSRVITTQSLHTFPTLGSLNTLMLQTAASFWSESIPNHKKNHRWISMIFFVLGILIMVRLTHL